MRAGRKIDTRMIPRGLGIICTINNGKDHTLAFVRRFAGIPDCRLFLFLDVPEHIEYFGEEWSSFVTLTQCTPEYWQNEIGDMPKNMPEKQHTNIRKGASLAREQGLKWCVSIDSDELILNLPDLTAKIDQLGSDADLMRVFPAELIHDQRTAFSSEPFFGRYFKYCLQGDELNQAIEKLDPRLKWRLRSMRRVTRRLFFGHTNGKTIFRLDAPITTYKQHRQFSDQRELVEINLPREYQVLHYDAMNYQTWLAKWRRRISGYTRATAINEKRQLQTRLIARSMKFLAGFRSKRLFRKWYLFNRKQIDQMIDVGIVFELPGRP